MSEPDFSTFPLWERGNQFEDFEVDQVFEHHWGRTLTAGDAMLFSSIALRYCPLYVNAEYAKSEGHRDRVVDPMLVLATVIGLSVEDLSEVGGPFLGVNEVEFGAYVYPNDTITCVSEVIDKRESASRPDTGIVTWGTCAKNQSGDVVVKYQRTNFVAKRSRHDGPHQR
ncbi:MAG: MaoC family dehydratase [Gammaproteobacteria bacterium]|jgi:itaconyl-CoA hydratase|nr:MaoC family dehydratase [Gammaproteobacteria bacterium]